MSQPDPLFLALLRQRGLPEPETEVYFAKPRRFRFDYAWPAERIALEVEGGAFSGGRHTRGAGFRRDIEKYNLAASLGWLVLRCLPEQLCTPSLLDLLETVHRRAAA